MITEMGSRVLAALLAAQVSGCGAGAFACAGDSQCVDAGVAGSCEPDGWCSFPDSVCPSGQRYGGHAGDGLAGTCVADYGTTSVAGSELGPGSADPSVDVSSASSVGDDTMGTDASSTTTTTTSSSTTEVDSSSDGPSTCGDGVLQPGEACDAGQGNDDAGACLENCMIATCGDGHVRAGVEVCDAPDFGGIDCTTFGFVVGDLGCAVDCEAIDADACEGCQGDAACPPFGACNGAGDCGDSAVCVAIGGQPGTCLPPCDVECTSMDGAYCTASFNACALACEGDRDCPAGMFCTDLPSDELACMW